MAVTIHYNNGNPDQGVANGIDAGPYGYKDPNFIPNNGVLEIRNSSQRVAVVSADIVSYIEITPA